MEPDAAARGDDHPPPRSLEGLFEPRSVAVVGASDDPGKWGHWLARGALRAEHRRPAYLVNPSRSTVLGRRAWAAVRAIPGGVDLVVLAVPRDRLLDAVDDALAGSARALVAVSAGLGEAGGEGARLEAAIVARVRAANAVLLGPNCLGMVDQAAELYLASNDFPPGSVALLSQSGNLAIELGELASEAGLGFARFLSVGNQADLDLADLVERVAAGPRVRAVAVYGEDWRDGRRFLAAAGRVVARGIPVVVLTVGGDGAASRAARSHTGALVSDPAAVEAACRAVGARMARSPGEMIDVLQILTAPVRPVGSRLGILADGGGHGALAAETAAHQGFLVPTLEDDVRDALASVVRGSADNPVDLAGAGESDPLNFLRAAEVLGGSDRVDAVLVTGGFGGYHVYGARAAAREAEAARGMGAWMRRTGTPVLVHAIHRRSPTLDALREVGVPAYPRVDQALSALALARRGGESRGVPELPPPADAAAGFDYFSARRLLAAHGVRFLPALSARSPDEAAALSAQVGYPVVLKAAFLEHKSDRGGVRLDLRGASAVRDAARTMRELGDGPLSVESMAPAGGVELMIGARRDPRFGPLVSVGFGGVYAELLADIAVELAPVDEKTALAMLERLRGAGLLFGARGNPPLDVRAAARAVVAVSVAAASHPEAAAVEVNPLRVFRDAVLALDARMVPAAGKEAGPGAADKEEGSENT